MLPPLRLPSPGPPAAPAEEVPTHDLRGAGPPPAAHPRPDVVPGYRIVRELGRGGMGLVYEAIDVALNRPVALKILCEELAGDAGCLGRLGDEAEAVARLRHPDVVQIHHVGEHHGRPYMVLELVRGGSLARRLVEHGPLDPAAAVALVAAVARAVHHAHERRVIHRDLKPANILLSNAECGMRNAESGQEGTGSDLHSAFRIPHSAIPKVTDFGVAKLLGEDRGRTRTGAVVGTLGYIAPELIDRPRAASPASDVYSLGVVLYECLTGLLPLVGRSVAESFRLTLDVEPLPPSRYRAGLPAGLDAICRKALAKAPADRYASAAAMADDLDRVAAGRRVRGWAADQFRRLRRVVKPVAVVAVVGAAVCGGLWQERRVEATAAARSGRDLVARGEFTEAEEVSGRGLRRVAGVPGCRDLTDELGRDHHAARRGRLAGELHRLVDRFRFAYDADGLTAADLRTLAAAGDALWAAREAFAAPPGAPLAPALEARLRTDLLDLVLLTADLRCRDGGGSEEACGAAVARLDEAESLLGPGLSLGHVREVIRSGKAAAVGPDESVWALYAAGRFRLNHGDPAGAVPLLRRAVDREPGAFWPNFYLALASHRLGHPDEAVSGFSACLAVADRRRGLCHYNRAVAHEAAGNLEAAARDLDRAAELEPDLAAAVFRRGVVRLRLGQFEEAAADLERVCRGDPDPAAGWYHLALVRRAAGDGPAAARCATEAVRLNPADARFRALLAELQPDRP